ncbi:protein kinase [candidate division KSB1 bacterium]|nr:protein kinase [candidate division KSB1 bacterium]NIR70577.1 protein kinase [candidate division KSB1 bacterium]NIS27713.1 protein kinase [candidate division KSB1 bacterium]NIT74541.1 protein kinase [candidate division KSB1 bacterium]NIU28366.1 protein kinase [candidate division KSB1 bacterium]
MKNPFIAGNWVRGENFFGRKHLLNEILEGRRNNVWITGTRRFGKTSFLKQLELLTNSGDHADKYVSIFWDMQGSQDVDGLKESLLESIEDAEERFEDIGVDLEELEEKNLFEILRALKRKTKDAGFNLMLLCDEAEELINIEKNNPEALPKLRRFFQRGDNVYTILTATKRLSVLENTSIPDTSPFLYGFVPPVYLSRLEDDEAIRLIKQWEFRESDIEEILEKTNNHPYLIQLICRRLVETGDLSQVIEEVSHDDMISHFFSVDFQYLAPEEREILLHLMQNQGLSLEELQPLIGVPQDRLIKLLYELAQSGAIKQDNRHYRIANYFFEKWLQREKQKLYSDSDIKRSEPTQEVISPRPKDVRLPEVGQRLAQHEILEKLSSGGMGVVFKGKDLKLNRLVALKVLLPGLISDSTFQERFVVEAQAASSLNHPNIATIYQVGEEKGIHFISMEYVEGHTLRAWDKVQTRTLSDKLQVMQEAAKGLAYAHKKGIVHRDIKSDNIMVSNEGVVKVMDFGLAKMQRKADKSLTKTGTTMGTLSYMSPEQASGLPIDHRSDIFSFGIVLYELFGGRMPFGGDFELTVLYAIMNEEPQPLRQVNAELPKKLEDVVHKALEKDRDNRYQSMDSLLGDLQEIG